MAQTKMEILITGDPTEFLKALDQAKTGAAAAGTKITSSVKAGAQEAEGALQQFAGASATAAQSYIKDQRMQGRQANFLAKEILDLGIVGKGAGEMLKGGFGLAIEALGGLREGLSKVAVGLILFEAIKVGVTVFNHFSEAAKKAAEEAKAFGEQVASSLTKAVDKLTDLRNKSRPDSAQTGDSLDATVRLRDRNVARLGELERELAAINAKYVADVASMGEGAGPGVDTRAQADEMRRLTEEVAKYNAMVSATTEVQATQRRAEAAARAAALADSEARGNAEYEMGPGDGGVLAVGQKIDLLRQKFAQVSQEAAAIIAKARGASEEELERLRLKGELIGLNAQLTASTTQAEIDATRRRIQAAREESAAKMRGLGMVGPGNVGGESQFGKDRNAQIEDETRQDELSGKFSGFDTPDVGDAKKGMDGYNKSLHTSIEMGQQWGATLGDAIAGIADGSASLGRVFARVGQQIVATLTQMLITTITTDAATAASTQARAMGQVTANAAVAASGAASSVATTPFIGPVLAIAAMGAILGAVLGLLGGIGGKAIGGAVNTGIPYIVGEAGQEMFVPSVSGSIVPNSQLGRGRGLTVNINAVDARSVSRLFRDHDGELMRTIRNASRAGRG